MYEMRVCQNILVVPTIGSLYANRDVYFKKGSSPYAFSYNILIFNRVNRKSAVVYARNLSTTGGGSRIISSRLHSKTPHPKSHTFSLSLVCIFKGPFFYKQHFRWFLMFPCMVVP